MRKRQLTAMEKARLEIDNWDKEGRSVTRELARYKAEAMWDAFQAYLSAGFAHEDAIRLILQEQLIAQSGNRPIVQGLSFSDLLKHGHRPEEL